MVALIKLLSGIRILEEKNNLENEGIDKIYFNSREKSTNGVFFCFKGENSDGHDFVGQAKLNGAKVAVVEKFVNVVGIHQIKVESTRSAFALACKNLYERACDKMKIIGVCGTNGKTTTSFIISHILNFAGEETGIIGTSGASWCGKKIEFGMTTPDPNILHKILYEMHKDGVKNVVMEVSAHAIALKKIDGITFQIAVMTNISEDHLDYFLTFEKYKQTKLEFMNSKNVKSVVLNADDDNLSKGINGDVVNKITYGITCPSDCFVVEPTLGAKGSSFVLNFLDNVVKISTKLCGIYNIENIMAGFVACAMMGVSIKDIQSAIATFEPVEGRFNVFSSNRGFDVVLDYAHTPDGLQKVLETAGGLTPKKLICVFGCGGDRDKQKRPLMGAIAEKLCDEVIVTSDNPRFESPSDIVSDIVSGMKQNRHRIILDRAQAIEYALSIAGAKDIICVCGKGAEPYIDQNGVKTPYLDKDVILKNI